MRNPNDPVPGFEDEYTGTAGHEKAIHHDSFHVKQMPKLRKSDFDSGYEWVEIRPGRWKLLPKRVLEDADRRR